VDVEHPVYRRREAVREVNSAGLAIRQRRPREAAEAYLRAINWTPEDPLIHYELANVYRSLEGAWQEAVRRYTIALVLLKKDPPGLDPAQVKLYIERAERERARLERAHTGTLAYLRAKFFSAFGERRIELALFAVVFASVLFFLWRA
jgi:tetratricopeptide (TPR) repeat protein